MSEINQYRMLNIKTNGYLPAEEVTDEKILQNYKEAKEIILQRLSEGMLKKESIKEFITKIEKDLEIINQAFKILQTEEKRKIYEEKYIKQKLLEEKQREEESKKQIEEVETRQRKEESKNQTEEIETKRINTTNRAASVRENKNYIPYTPEYDDENVTILGLADIRFMNGNQYQDQIKEYNILLKRRENAVLLGYEFYSNINIQEMSNPEYKGALYKAIINGIEKNERYIGVIEKDPEQNYIIVLDGGQKDAAKEHQLQKINEIKAKAKERQGVGR